MGHRADPTLSPGCGRGAGAQRQGEGPADPSVAKLPIHPLQGRLCGEPEIPTRKGVRDPLCLLGVPREVKDRPPPNPAPWLCELLPGRMATPCPGLPAPFQDPDLSLPGGPHPPQPVRAEPGESGEPHLWSEAWPNAACQPPTLQGAGPVLPAPPTSRSWAGPS